MSDAAQRHGPVHIPRSRRAPGALPVEERGGRGHGCNRAQGRDSRRNGRHIPLSSGALGQHGHGPHVRREPQVREEQAQVPRRQVPRHLHEVWEGLIDVNNNSYQYLKELS